MSMTPALRMAGLAADQLQWAEDHHHWDYMEKLTALLQTMGARIIHLDGGYVVQFTY